MNVYIMATIVIGAASFSYGADENIVTRIKKSATELSTEKKSLTDLFNGLPGALDSFSSDCNCPPFVQIIKDSQKIVQPANDLGSLVTALAELNKSIEDFLKNRLDKLKDRLACLSLPNKDRIDPLSACTAQKICTDRGACLRAAADDVQALVVMLEPLILGKQITKTQRGESLVTRLFDLYASMPDGDTRKSLQPQITALAQTLDAWNELLGVLKNMLPAPADGITADGSSTDSAARPEKTIGDTLSAHQENS